MRGGSVTSADTIVCTTRSNIGAIPNCAHVLAYRYSDYEDCRHESGEPHRKKKNSQGDKRQLADDGVFISDAIRATSAGVAGL